MPLVFLVGPNADPTNELIRFSKEFNISDDNFLKKTSGLGQIPLIENSLARARDKGLWISVQNCHLDPQLWPILE